MFSLLTLTAICAIFLIKIIQWLYKRYKFNSIVSKIPGPKGHPIVGNTIDFLRLSRTDRFKWIQKHCEQFKGGIFCTWFGPKFHVHLTSGETASMIFRSKSLITKSDFYDFFHPWLGKGLITATDSIWFQHRKLISPTFHFKILEEFVDVITEKAEILTQCIESELKLNPKSPINTFEALSRCALDVICESAMGVNINAQIDHQSEYSTALANITYEGAGRIYEPWLYPDWIYYKTSRGKLFKKSVAIAHKFTNKVISDRKLARQNEQKPASSIEDNEINKPKRQAFLDHLLDTCERENMPLTDDELRAEVETFLFAGHDTTATAMSWALLCIGNNPEVQDKIHEEQLLVFGDSKEPATLQQLSELKYLDRVMKEALRLFPSAPTMGRRITEDVEIAGYKIPEGSFIFLELHHINRNSDDWPNPTKFDPDRFLAENCNARHPYAYVPFSAGVRNCVGQKFALLEEKIVLTALLRKWRIKSVLKTEDAKMYNAIILRPENGNEVYFIPK